MPYDDIEGWLERLDDENFDRLWVPAVMSAVIEGDIDTADLAMVLMSVRDRLR